METDTETTEINCNTDHNPQQNDPNTGKSHEL